MLNLVSLSPQSLASCVNYFVWNCFTCFSNTKIGSVTSFSILFNFQGPVRRSLSGWRLDYFTTEAVFCQALFFEAFERSELGCFKVSRCWPELFSVYWFFSKASCWDFRSHSFVSALGAHIYYHIQGGLASLFSKFFALFFAFVYRSQFFAPNFRVFRAGLPGFFLFI